MRLPETLRHLANQKLPADIPWELIVVDNASTDKTKETALDEWNKYNLPAEIKVIDEKEQGVIYARKKGVRVALFEYIVFVDDDNWLHDDYLEKAFQLMEKMPDAGALGGSGEVATDGELPKWWEENKNSFAVGKQSTESGNVSSRGYLWGAGLISRKKILDEVFDSRYPFILSGRKGAQISSGDDSEMCSRIHLLGWELYYNENLHFKHFIPKERLTDNYKNQMIEGFELIYGVQKKYNLAIDSIRSTLYQKLATLIKKSAAWVFSNFEKRKFDLLKGYLLLAFGFDIIKDREYRIIYQFSRHK